MTKLFLSLLAGIAIAVPLSFAFLRRAGDAAGERPAAPESAPVDPGAAPVTSAPLAVEPQPGERLARPSRTSVTGRVIGPDGAPVSGASVVLEILNDFSWKEERDLVTSSDESGRFRLDVDHPRDLMVARVTVHVPGQVDRVRTLDSGTLLADVELGDVAFGSGAELSGRLRCEGGLPDWPHWRILVATHEIPRDVLPRRSTSLPLESENGEFRIVGLPEGEVELLVHHPILGVVSRSEARLSGGANEPVVLDWSGPDPRRCVRVRVDADGPLLKGAVRLTGGGLDQVGTSEASHPNDFLFADLPEGTYEVAIQPRKKLLWNGSVTPGHVLEVDLRGKGIR